MSTSPCGRQCPSIDPEALFTFAVHRSLPSDVQDEAIPLMLGGGDVMVAAQTGSGKTGAFGLPAVQLAYEIRQRQLSGVGSGSAAGGAAAAAASAASPRVGPAALSVEDRSSWLAVDPTGLIAQSRNEHTWGGVRGTVGEPQPEQSSTLIAAVPRPAYTTTIAPTSCLRRPFPYYC